MNQQLQTPKGFRDFLPRQARARQFVVTKVKEIFERFGFVPLETPTIEYASILMGKYGEEADKLVFQFKDRGDRELALRYDQTVPTARVLAQYQNELPKYFRRYQIQNVFRAEKPQKGRYREFTQCDIDIFGSTSPIADAEVIACTYFSFKNVGYPTVQIKINDRKILFATFEQFTTPTVSTFSIIQSVDKLDKINTQGVVEQLISKGLSTAQATAALEAVSNAKPTENLQDIIKKSIQLGVPSDAIIFTSSLARGLDYYTGMIFEVIVPEYTTGSLGGGGRYDNLIDQLGGVNIPAVGIAFGFDRMVEAAELLNLIPTTSASSILVTVFDELTAQNALTTAKILRENNIATELYPNLDPLEKQLKYADKNGFAYVVIQGPDELAKGLVQLKDMKNRTSETLTIEKVIEMLNPPAGGSG